MVEGKEPVNVIEDDPADNKYLASAIEGEADFIISGDHHLLNLKTYQDIETVNAAKFISIWKETEETNNK